jgi:hypothetical protein
MTAELASAKVRTQAEIMLRAVRDHLADSLTTLPHLLQNANEASIHFYFGNMTAMRKYLAPSLINAYVHWHETKDLSLLDEYSIYAQSHWNTLAEELNQSFKQSNDASSIEALIKERLL